MKISLALGPRQPLSRQTAWGCLTTNLSLPGFGSLMAGRVSGYFQAFLSIGGFILSLLFGVRFLVWSVANWSRLYAPGADPVEAMQLMWSAGKWAFLGVAVFTLAWLWALATSLLIVSAAKNAGPPRTPPVLS